MMSANKEKDLGTKARTGNPLKVKTNLKSGLSQVFGKWFYKDENGLWRLNFGRDGK